MYGDMIDVSADARGAVGELYDEDAVDDNCYFSADAAEDDNFTAKVRDK